MPALGLDIGTTKICALVLDEGSGAVPETRYGKSVFIPGANTWNRLQNPEDIFTAAEALVSALTKKYDGFRSMGISCQMHGILYVDSGGRAVSPLYTWQDMSAARLMESGETYAAYLAGFSPGAIAPGYGLASFFYHLSVKEVPPGAAKLCTIGDYIAMRLSASALPVMHAANAGGMGFFDIEKNDFDRESAERAGIDTSFLPRVVADREVTGGYAGTPVCVAIGDNQASFIGSVEDAESSLLVNMGTGSQISFVSGDSRKRENSCVPGAADALEARPFFDGKRLFAGASLCGGRAYAILEGFFRQVIEMAGLKAGFPLYDVMDAAAEASSLNRDSPLAVNTLFAGTRRDPSLKGSILDISEDNFNPGSLALGFLYGAARELYDYYAPLDEKRSRLVGAGNGIRKSPLLRRVLAEVFAMPLEIPLYGEEAAFGAALFGLYCTGCFKSVSEAQRLVKYREAAPRG